MEYKLPSDFIKKMKLLLSSEWTDFENSLHCDSYHALRFNPLKKGLDCQDYSRLLSELSILKEEPVPWAEYAFYYNEEARPGKHPYHEAGLYYIQEPSAMCAAALLAPSPGERILDLCAAPGGKSTHLASFLNQEGLLIANEIHPSRCKILSQNIERLGIANAIVTNEDSQTLAEHFPEYFHKILVDAPCSGEGMFRKNSDAILEWSQNQVEICAKRQLSILEHAAAMLINGGSILYSTCTFSPEENEEVIGQFLKAHPEFSIVYKENPFFDSGRPAWENYAANACVDCPNIMEELSRTFRLWPHHLHGEGHFAAILKKSGQPPIVKALKRKHRKDNEINACVDCLNKNLLAVLREFTSQTLSKKMEDYILTGNLTLFGEQLYMLPLYAPDFSGLRVLRAGLHIGSFKKNRFIPGHALALFLGHEDVKNSISLSLSNAQAAMYYNGETLEINGKNGWCLVCINNYSAGWGKITNGILKNHYPKGLRKEVCYE